MITPAELVGAIVIVVMGRGSVTGYPSISISMRPPIPHRFSA